MSETRIVVGIVGKYCSGKNILAGILSHYGYLEIDVDKIGHEVLESSKGEVVKMFGKDILGNGGEIDRKKLGDIVFSDKKKLRLLESILHPKMKKRVKDIIENSERNIVINAALLYRMGLHELCDVVICVKSSIWKLIFRGMKRDELPLWKVLRRLLSQLGICFKPSGYRVDTYNVWNNGSVEKFRKEVLKLFRERGLI